MFFTYLFTSFLFLLAQSPAQEHESRALVTQMWDYLVYKSQIGYAIRVIVTNTFTPTNSGDGGADPNDGSDNQVEDTERPGAGADDDAQGPVHQNAEQVHRVAAAPLEVEAAEWEALPQVDGADVCSEEDDGGVSSEEENDPVPRKLALNALYDKHISQPKMKYMPRLVSSARWKKEIGGLRSVEGLGRLGMHAGLDMTSAGKGFYRTKISLSEESLPLIQQQAPTVGAFLQHIYSNKRGGGTCILQEIGEVLPGHADPGGRNRIFSETHPDYHIIVSLAGERTNLGVGYVRGVDKQADLFKTPVSSEGGEMVYAHKFKPDKFDRIRFRARQGAFLVQIAQHTILGGHNSLHAPAHVVVVGSTIPTDVDLTGATAQKLADARHKDFQNGRPLSGALSLIYNDQGNADAIAARIEDAAERVIADSQLQDLDAERALATCPFDKSSLRRLVTMAQAKPPLIGTFQYSDGFTKEQCSAGGKKGGRATFGEAASRHQDGTQRVAQYQAWHSAANTAITRVLKPRLPNGHRWIGRGGASNLYITRLSTHYQGDKVKLVHDLVAQSVTDIDSPDQHGLTALECAHLLHRLAELGDRHSTRKERTADKWSAPDPEPSSETASERLKRTNAEAQRRHRQEQKEQKQAAGPAADQHGLSALIALKTKDHKGKTRYLCPRCGKAHVKHPKGDVCRLCKRHGEVTTADLHREALRTAADEHQ